jgi:hypothetical protein
MGDIGAVAGAAIQANAAKSAADKQSNAAEYAANKIYSAASDANQTQKDEFNTVQGNEKPFLQAGQTAVRSLNDGTQTGGQFNTDLSKINNGEFATPITSVANGEFAPGQTYDASKVLNDDPGYQFRLDQGTQALQRAEAAQGITGSGAALKAATQYTQDYASNEYQNAYSRWQQNRTTDFNEYEQGTAQDYNEYNTNRSQDFNDLASIAGTGQTANAQIAGAGTNEADNISANTINAANAASNYSTSAAAAQAAGTVGTANAWNGAIGTISNNTNDTLAAMLALG